MITKLRLIFPLIYSFKKWLVQIIIANSFLVLLRQKKNFLKKHIFSSGADPFCGESCCSKKEKTDWFLFEKCFFISGSCKYSRVFEFWTSEGVWNPCVSKYNRWVKHIFRCAFVPRDLPFLGTDKPFDV